MAFLSLVAQAIMLWCCESFLAGMPWALAAMWCGLFIAHKWDHD